MSYIEEVVDGLVGYGIKYAFGITGSGVSSQLIRELQLAGVKYYPVAHEAAAAFMAGACCRDGKSIAVAISIKGPGFINLIPGVLSNHYEGRPALTISEAYGCDVPFYRTHKRLNHELMCRTVCKSYNATNNVESVEVMLDLAQEEPPGPVHLDLVGSFQKSIVDSSGKNSVVNIPTKHKLNLLDDLLQHSKRPCLILGSLAVRLDMNWYAVNVPVVTTAAAKGCYDETLAWSAGIVTGEVTDLSPESSALCNADLIVSIGLRNTEMIKVEPYSIPLVMIDKIDKKLQEGFEADLVLISDDLEDILAAVFGGIANKSWGSEIVAEYRLKIKQALLLDQWLIGMAFNLIQKNMSDETILVLDTGFFCTVGETEWKARRPNLFCGSSVGRFMGSAIPTAIGVSISSKNSPVLCVIGDGGISPYFGEISLAVRERLPIVFVLMTDGRYGSVAAFLPDDIETKRAVNIGVDTWCNAVQGLNCKSARILNEVDLANILLDWQQDDGPLFLELPFDPESYSSIAKKLR